MLFCPTDVLPVLLDAERATYEQPVAYHVLNIESHFESLKLTAKATTEYYRYDVLIVVHGKFVAVSYNL